MLAAVAVSNHLNYRAPYARHHPSVIVTGVHRLHCPSLRSSRRLCLLVVRTQGNEELATDAVRNLWLLASRGVGTGQKNCAKADFSGKSSSKSGNRGASNKDLLETIEEAKAEIETLQDQLNYQSSLQTLRWVYDHLDGQEFPLFHGFNPKGEGYTGWCNGKDLVKLIIYNAALEKPTLLETESSLYDKLAISQFEEKLNEQIKRVSGMKGGCYVRDEDDGIFEYDMDLF